MFCLSVIKVVNECFIYLSVIKVVNECFICCIITHNTSLFPI